MTSSPSTVVVPLAASAKRVHVQVDVLNNRDTGSKGEVMLQVPQGGRCEPPRAPFAFARAGERETFRFTVTIPSIADRAIRSRPSPVRRAANTARATRPSTIAISRRASCIAPSTMPCAASTSTVVPGLKVGYVMGIGDQVPARHSQLGYEVTLLDEHALARGPLALRRHR